MKVILLQDVKKVGKKYDIKNVSDGFAMNSLIPNKKAKIATEKDIKELEVLKEKHKEIVKEENAILMKNIQELSNSTIDVQAKFNKEGKLFSSIGKEEIILSIKDQKALDISPENIILDKPIKEVGGNEIEIKADGKSVKFTVNIIPKLE